MELKELPKSEEKELSEFEKDDLFLSIVRGKDLTETVHTSRGDFELKFPRMKDLEAIGRLSAYRMNGISAKCFSEGVLALIDEVATLDVITVRGPAWFENIKRENPNLSWQDIPDQGFIQEVYAKAYEFRLKVQKVFNGNTEKGNKQMDNRENDTSSDGPGLFEGMSGSARAAR